MEEHASLLGCAHILVSNDIILSLELRSVHRRAIAKAEMGRWCTGSFASLKPELALLTHESCLQAVWDLTSHWKSLNKRFLIPALLSPSQTGCLRAPTAWLFPFPRAGPSLGPRQPQGGMPCPEQHWGAWGQSRGTLLPDLVRAAS